MEMVLETFGKETWNNILTKSKVNEVEMFLKFQNYPDSDTFALLQCVCDISKMPMNKLLHKFGDYFITYHLNQDYHVLLTRTGVDFVTLIQNADSMHHLVTKYFFESGVKYPSFRCYDKDNGQIMVLYSSIREALVPMAIGLLEAVAREIFNQKAIITKVTQNRIEIGPNEIIFQTILKVELKCQRVLTLRWALGDLKEFQKTRKESVWQADDGFKVQCGTETLIRAEDFKKAFPYHLLLDRTLCLRQWGQTLADLSAVTMTNGTPFTDVGAIVEPPIHHTFDMIRLYINRIFTISFKLNIYHKPLILQGQMMWFPRSNHLLFQGSPLFDSLMEMEEHRIFMDDIPIFDVTRDVLISCEQRYLELEITKKNDLLRLRLKKMYRYLEEERSNTEDLLHEMLPKKIASQLKSGQTVSGEIFKICTIVFSDVVSFTQISAICTAHEVVNMLNNMYYRFDTHTEVYNVFKVKTIGDAYMAVSGVPEKQVDHAQRMADFAMAMIEETAKVISPATHQAVEIRVGIHSGAIVAGVIGKKKPRYDIYGDTVNTAARMEAYSLPGRIHVSMVTFRLLYPHGYKFLARGNITVKKKGEQPTYFLVGDMKRMITQPSDKFKDQKVLFHTPKKKLFKTMTAPMPAEDARSLAINAESSDLLSKSSRAISLFSRRGEPVAPEQPKNLHALATLETESKSRSIAMTISSFFSSISSRKSDPSEVIQSEEGSAEWSAAKYVEDDDAAFSPYFDRHIVEEQQHVRPEDKQAPVVCRLTKVCSSCMLL